MGKRLLPQDGTPEAEAVKNRFRNGDYDALVKELGFANAGSLKRSIYSVYKMKVEDSQVVVSDLTVVENAVLTIVKKSPVSVGEISRQIDRSSETVIKLLDSLRAKHYEVELDATSRLVELPHTPSKSFKPTEFEYFRHRYRIGLVADTQIGSKFQQITLLHDAYAHFDELDVDCILHAGDVFDGVGMYRGHHQELFLHNAEDQRQYAIANYPKPKKVGLKTYMIAGNHDYSFYKQNGYDIVAHLCQERDDLVYRGFFNHLFRFKEVDIGIRHPSGGVAYARSYQIQKHIENLTGFVQSIKGTPPAVMVFGHWHVPVHLPSYMGVDAISMPCFQAATVSYLIPKGLMPTVGYAVAEIYLNAANNLSATRIEFVNMNDRIADKDW